jgi:AAA domain
MGYLTTLPQGIEKTYSHVSLFAQKVYAMLIDLEQESGDGPRNTRRALADFIKARGWAVTLDSRFYSKAAEEHQEIERENELAMEFGAVSKKRNTDQPALVDGLIVAGQTALFGGPFKGCKTLLAVQLGICAANAKAFLGHHIEYPLHVGMFLAEATHDWTRNALSRAADSVGGNLERVTCFNRLPNLASKKGRDDLSFLVKRNRWDMVVIDPLYQAMGSKADVSNIYSMAGRMRAVVKALWEEGATTVFVHHSGRALDPGKPMSLGDLLGAGVSEFARSWILVNRLTPFDQQRKGHHELVVSTGTCQGDAELLRVDVNEGLDGSPYSIEHKPYDPAQQATPKARGKRSTPKDGQPRGDASERILEALGRLAKRPGARVARKTIQEDLNMSGKTLTSTLNALKDAKKITIETEPYVHKGKACERYFVRQLVP